MKINAEGEIRTPAVQSTNGSLGQSSLEIDARGHRLKPGLATSAIWSNYNIWLHYNDIGSMKVTVRFIPSKEAREVELEDGSTGMALIDFLSLTPDSHILARSEQPIPIDEELRDGESVTLISVVSGG